VTGQRLDSNYSIIFRSPTYHEFVKIKNRKKRHAELDSANKIKEFRDPEIVDP